MPVRVFYSYASADAEYQQELEKYLVGMRRDLLIESWHFKDITAGKEWHKVIDEKLNSASLILLLLSADFMASEYIWSVEVQRALSRHEAGEATVVPIVLRWSDWQKTALSKLQALPTPLVPINEWDIRERAWKSVVDGLRRTVEAMENGDGSPSAAAPVPAIAESNPPQPGALIDVHKVIRRFVKAFPEPFIHEPIDQTQLRRVIDPAKPLPPVFYRWRAYDGAIHWIDFSHLLLLRRVADLGFPIRLLIDDLKRNEDTDDLRSSTDYAIASIFEPGQAEHYWLRDTWRDRAKHQQAAEERGFDADTAEHLANVIKRMPGLDIRAEYWLQFMISLLGDDGRCIIYAWESRRAVYETLRLVRSIEPALVIRPVYRLAGKPAKSDPPGRDLIVEPRVYTTILSWIASDAAAADVRELAKYMTLNRSEERGADEAILQRASALLTPALHARIDGASPSDDFWRGALWLLEVMLGWNERYF